MNSERKEIYCSLYMKVWLEEIGDSTYAKVETGAAACVLPYRRVGKELFVTLLSELRPEAENKRCIKTVGGYCKEGESQVMCARRNLFTKLGIESDPLSCAGTMLGYTVVTIPIAYFVCEDWRIVSESAANCERVEMPLRDALDLALRGEVLDDCTRVSIMHLALLYRDNIDPP